MTVQPSQGLPESLRREPRQSVSATTPGRLTFAETTRHLIAICAPVDAGGRRILTLDVVEGRIAANYDPADLDEAAQVFVRELRRLAGQTEACGHCGHERITSAGPLSAPLAAEPAEVQSPGPDGAQDGSGGAA